MFTHARRLFCSLFLLVASACVVLGCSSHGEGTADEGYGRVAVVVSGLTHRTQLTAVVLEAGTTQVTLTYNSGTDRYEGAFVLPVGQYTVTGRAYVGTVQVGIGTANVTVVANATTALSLRILDTTGGQPPVDAGPFVSSLTASTTLAVVGQSVTLTATAVDANGDPITYAWASNCAGTFGAMAATTTWIPGAAGTCRITVTATSRGLSDSESLDLVVTQQSANGAVAPSIEYVPQPFVVTIRAGGCEVDFTDTNSMCTFTTFTPGTPLTVTVWYSTNSNFSTHTSRTLTDNCGGWGTETGAGVFSYTPHAGLCTMTATVTSAGVSSSLTMTYFGR